MAPGEDGVGAWAGVAIDDTEETGGSSARSCWFKLDADSEGNAKWPVLGPGGEIAYAWFFLYCDDEPVDPAPRLLAVDGPDGRPAARAMAEQAYRFLPLPAPEPAFNPPERAVVGVPTWLWTSARSWGSRHVTVAVTGLTVRVRATAVSATWRFAPGLRVLVCAGAGTRYDPDRPPSAQRTGCSYTFMRSSASAPGGAYAATATIEWRVEWRASDGTGGQLAPLRRTTGFRLPVTEVHTVVTGPGRRR